MICSAREWYSDTRWSVHCWSSSPQTSSSLRLLVLWLVRPHLFVIHKWLFIFSKNLFLSSAPLTTATQAFSTLWFLRKGFLVNVATITSKSMFPGLFFFFSNHYLTIPLSWHWRASRSSIPIILSAKGKATTTSFKDFDRTHNLNLPLTRWTL